jgi:hypothetical protein
MKRVLTVAKHGYRYVSVGVFVCGIAASACGGSTPVPEEPATPPPTEEEVEGLPEARSVPEEEDAEPAPTEPKAAPAEEPAFREGMSVDEAIAAVPQSAQRVNIEQDALAAPLMRPELYEPCALKGNQRFKVRVAVWNGRAVGLDLDTQPKNQKVEECLRQQVASVTWPDKVKSLNTVEFSY